MAQADFIPDQFILLYGWENGSAGGRIDTEGNFTSGGFSWDLHDEGVPQLVYQKALDFAQALQGDLREANTRLRDLEHEIIDLRLDKTDAESKASEYLEARVQVAQELEAARGQMGGTQAVVGGASGGIVLASAAAVIINKLRNGGGGERA